MVATQLESNFARRMFPSFDEPEFKATFNITVLRKEPMISLSNMNLLESVIRLVNLEHAEALVIYQLNQLKFLFSSVTQLMA